MPLGLVRRRCSPPPRSAARPPGPTALRPRLLARSIRLAAVLALTLLVGISFGGCSRKRSYSQATPDDVVRSAVDMVKNGDTAELGDLVYADSPEMRVFLNRLGDLFGHMQVLAKAVEKQFPLEMAELKEKAAKAAAEGKPDSLLGAIASAATGGGGRGRRSGGGGMGGPPVDENTAQDLINRLFADPYGWIELNAPRLSAMKTGDDTASVMLDDKPIIPVVGLPMRMESGKWYIALPTNFPGVANVMPRSKEQWSILVSVVKVLDRTVVEMTDDVNAGRMGTLDSLSKKAREKAALPGAVAFAAYMREMDVRGRVDRRVKQFQTRQRDWAKGRGESERTPSVSERVGDAGEASEAGVSPKLLTTITRLAPARIEPLVRKNKAPAFDKLSRGEFEALLATWLSEAGLRVNIEGDLSRGAIDAELSRWETAQKAAGVKKR